MCHGQRKGKQPHDTDNEQTYDRAIHFLTAVMPPTTTLAFAKNAVHDRREFLIDQASQLSEQSSEAATEEERFEFARLSAKSLHLARRLVPWCLAVEMMIMDEEIFNGEDEKDVIWMKGLKIAQALQVYEEEG